MLSSSLRLAHCVIFLADDILKHWKQFALNVKSCFLERKKIRKYYHVFFHLLDLPKEWKILQNREWRGKYFWVTVTAFRRVPPQ